MLVNILDTLRLRHELWNSTAFQDWMKESAANVQQLTDLAMSITSTSVKKNASEEKILLKLGIEPPQNEADVHRIMQHLRVVVNFERRKLEQLKLQSAEYEKEIKKQNDDRKANGELGPKRRTLAR